MNSKYSIKAVLGIIFVVLANAYSGVSFDSGPKLVEAEFPNNEVDSGFAAINLSVSFTASASCNCGCEDLEYEWDFGDGYTGTNADETHSYGSSGSGLNSVFLTVTCNGCGDSINNLEEELKVNVIKGIRVDKVGDVDNPSDDGRLCFDGVLNVKATALPDGVGGSDKIDWYVLIETGCESKTSDTDDGDLSSLSSFPTSNDSWGENTLKISIDGTDVTGQDGELNLTGTISSISVEETIEVYYDHSGTQCSASSPVSYNATYYYDDAEIFPNGTANDSIGSRCDLDYPHTITIGSLESSTTVKDYTSPEGYTLANNGESLSGIDVCGWSYNHEFQHSKDYDFWAPGTALSLSPDDDYMPDMYEGNYYPEKEGAPYDDNTSNTHTALGSYNTDDEAHALFTAEEWDVESMKSSDWARPGSQWEVTTP